ncbi:MAG: response regulator [Alphaproteobacteria bacterium]|nr:response regulator [Alphaproteobacteria bacterium]MBU1515279.1 response regulator [Alphaproteobacteria bacterium]MBU2092409.1 response regulator [Alphaproteobacteria bacterium]MBU2153003.1 response regulator [Alphaproteobacteria bacterium]MBU2305834.1 response regulator [Alphaproteobacteria bacterium]
MTVADPLISVVEDDESLRQAVVGLVRSLGYRVAAYANAEDFLAADGGRASDCVITDIQMPGLSGIDLKLRLIADGVRTPVIMVTARAEPALHQKAMASGACCLLRKPFTAEALIECLDQALAA